MYKLLIVDDEIEIRNGISRYFPWQEIGFVPVHQCENGRLALDYISEHPVDAVLCDIRMPVMNGIELAEQLYERKPEIKTVFLSGHRDFDYAKQALVYGVRNYIVKPTVYSEMYDVFTRLKLELDGARKEPRLAEAAEAGESEAEPSSFNEKIVGAVQQYVHRNFRKASLEEAARIVHMSPQYLSSYYKDKTGEYFSDYVHRVKMNKAAELLMDIQYKTYEVSELVGYSNAKNFARAFKSHFGCSPREYRNR